MLCMNDTRTWYIWRGLDPAHPSTDGSKKAQITIDITTQ